MTNKKLYLIGDPVDHSLSPLLHGAMIAQTGVHYTYEVRRVQPRAARADHHRADCAFLHGHSLLRAKPPSASSTCPAA